VKLAKNKDHNIDPRLILSEEERRERFKNYFKKKDEKDRQLMARKFVYASTSRTHPRPILPK
jgi:hypothetical protein